MNELNIGKDFGGCKGGVYKKRHIGVVNKINNFDIQYSFTVHTVDRPITVIVSRREVIDNTQLPKSPHSRSSRGLTNGTFPPGRTQTCTLS